jgi:hypothetical protein
MRSTMNAGALQIIKQPVFPTPPGFKNAFFLPVDFLRRGAQRSLYQIDRSQSLATSDMGTPRLSPPRDFAANAAKMASTV